MAMRSTRVCRLVLMLAGIFLTCSCAPTITPAPVPTSAVRPLFTAAPIVATPPPGPVIALEAYMTQVHERVLVEFGQRIAANRDLLTRASSRSFDADILCPGPASGSWQEFDDLTLESSVLRVPPLADEFHAALTDALATATRSAESYEWFCTTYSSFGQPAEGMWGRLSVQVRACESRLADLRSQWVALGGEALGLLW